MSDTTPELKNFIPNSYIKGVAFEIPKPFRYDHAPFDNNVEADQNSINPYYGREAEHDRFLSILRKAKTKKGVYLVAGYRGMGKTSFVERVLNDYTQDVIKNTYKRRPLYKKRIQTKNICKRLINHIPFISRATYTPEHVTKTIKLHISAPGITELDILRQATSQLKDKLKDSSRTNKRLIRYKKMQRRLGILSLVLVFLFWVLPFLIAKGYIQFDTLTFFIDYNLNNTSQIILNNLRHIYYFINSIDIWLPTLMLTCYAYVTYKITSIKRDNIDPYFLTKSLFNRAYSTVSKEKSNQIDIASESILGKINLYNDKETQNYPLASSKELEQELIMILEKISNLTEFQQSKYFKDRVSPEIVFVFDELDKVTLVDNEMTSDYPDYRNSSIDNIDYKIDENRSRRGMVINILGNLKSFLTQAHARFIFIAGREMFDASLADVSDRQSLLSSIFNHTIYINSFLKEPAGPNYVNQAGITDIIERYLINILNGYNDGRARLNWYYEDEIVRSIGGLNDDFERRKALFTLQKLIVYLTYRSNGSPKKLSRAIENFITVKTIDDDFKKHNIIVNAINTDKTEQKERLFLLLDYDDQYRIGFINYLFRPYIINKSSYLKKLSDNTLVTTPYVMDHLIKFHPFAFSIHNLEQIPEVISSSSTQAFRNYVKSIVDYLSLNHVRETHVNLFSYKFISKSENELNYLTLKFEEEAAAFNFTLDESYPVKLHIRKKLKALRSIFTNNGADSQIYSISFLNGWLGDLYFFDQEFDDAINVYSDAIKDITNRNFEQLNFRDFSLMVNFKLKLGLCFEKMKSYEEAISFYTDAINNTKGFLIYTFTNKKDIKISYPTSVINDLLQVINQCFIAKAYAQEKMSFGGFSLWKAKHNLESFLEVVYSVSARVPSNNYLTLANYFLNLGNLAYYKNHRISKKEIKILFSRVPLFDTENIISILKKLGVWGKGSQYSKYTSPNFALLYYLLSLICVKRYYTYNNKEEKKISKYFREQFDIDKEVNKHSIHGAQYNNYIYSCEDEDSFLTILNILNNKSCNNRYAKKIHGVLLSNIGNCLLQSLVIKNHTSHLPKTLKHVQLDPTRYYNSILKGLRTDEIKSDKVSFELIIKLYKQSSQLYALTGTKVSQTFQLRKVLYLIRSVFTRPTNLSVRKDLMKLVDEQLLIKLYELNSEISDVSDKKQYQKYKKTLGVKPFGNIDNQEAKQHIDDSLSNHTEDREIWLLRSHLDLTLAGYIEPTHKKIVHNNNSIATQYGRLGELLYEEKRWWSELDRWGNINNLPNQGYIQSCIINHLFACFSIIRISNSLKTNMMISPSLVGYIYYKTAKCIEMFKVNNVLTKNVYETLKEFLKTDEFIIYEPNYFYRRAKMFLEKSKSLHTQGKEYETKMNQSVYLEDDFNDNSNHFGIALDRFYLYAGRIDKLIYSCRKKLADDENHIQLDSLSSALKETKDRITHEADYRGLGT